MQPFETFCLTKERKNGMKNSNETSHGSKSHTEAWLSHGEFPRRIGAGYVAAKKQIINT